MRTRTIAVSLSVLAAGGLAGGAFAADQSSSNPRQAFLNDAAHRLHVSPARLSAALKQAFIDRINAAVSAGRLTPAQARAIKQHIAQGLALPGPGGPGFQIEVPSTFGPPAILMSAASYLGMTGGQLLQQLRSGKSLAQIASARGKSKSGLEKSITGAVRSRLAQAVKAGRLPRPLAQRLLAALTQHVQDLVNGGPGGFRFGIGPPGPPPRELRIAPGGPPPAGAWIGPGGLPPGGASLPIPPQVLRGLT